MKLIHGAILLLVPGMLHSQSADQSEILMPPYLQAVTPTGICVLVESRSLRLVTVEYGTTPSYGSVATTWRTDTTGEGTFVHKIRLDGLEPHTRYHYRASQGSDLSPDAAFTTASGPGTHFRFAWFADCRSGVEVHDSICARILDARPDVSLYGGDIARNGAYSSFKSDFFRPLQLALIAQVPFFNATGNHEGWGVNTKAFTEAPPSPSGTEEYYSFDYGDMHVLVLNTEAPYAPGTPQFEFARNDLASQSKAWTIVISHKHAYCSGGHGEDGDLKTMATEIFEPDKVAMCISGHSHFYQHNIVNGIHYLIIGTAGAPLYVPSRASYTVKSLREYNYAIGDVSPSLFRLLVYNEHGAVLDSVVLSKPVLEKKEESKPRGSLREKSLRTPTSRTGLQRQEQPQGGSPARAAFLQEQSPERIIRSRTGSSILTR